MGRDIYIASKTRLAPRWRALRDERGLPIVSSWIDEAGAGETKSHSEFWQRVVREVGQASALVIYREPGEVLVGAFVEMGVALATGVPVFVAGEVDSSVTHHPLVVECPSFDDALARALSVCQSDGEVVALVEQMVGRQSVANECRRKLAAVLGGGHFASLVSVRGEPWGVVRLTEDISDEGWQFWSNHGVLCTVYRPPVERGGLVFARDDGYECGDALYVFDAGRRDDAAAAEWKRMREEDRA